MSVHFDNALRLLLSDLVERSITKDNNSKHSVLLRLRIDHFVHVDTFDHSVPVLRARAGLGDAVSIRLCGLPDSVRREGLVAIRLLLKSG